MIKFNHGVTVLCGQCDYYDVYMIDIDDNRIELNDSFGMVIGTINISELNKCEIINYDGNGNIESLSKLNMVKI